MDMKRTFHLSRFMKFISLAILVLYTTYPYLNGLGCDFHSQAKHDNYSIYATCKAGLLSVIATNSITRESIKYEGIYGKSDSTLFFYVYEANVLDEGDISLRHISSAMHQSHYIIATLVSRNNNDWILQRSPYYNVFLIRRTGRMGFFDS